MAETELKHGAPRIDFCLTNPYFSVGMEKGGYATIAKINSDGEKEETDDRIVVTQGANKTYLIGLRSPNPDGPIGSYKEEKIGFGNFKDPEAALNAGLEYYSSSQRLPRV